MSEQEQVPHLEIAQHYWNVLVPKYGINARDRVLVTCPGRPEFVCQDWPHPRWFPDAEYRFKPDTVKIGNREVVRWLTVEPESNTYCWFTDLLQCNFIFRRPYFAWHDREAFNRGLVYPDTEEGCEQARAMGEALALVAQGGER